MIVLSKYIAVFDRSADDESADGGTAVAGFVSTAEQWALWEEDWNTVLGKFGAPYFHMREFGASRGAFAGDKWQDENYRRYFVAELVGTIKKWAVVTVGGYMEHQIYRDANQLCEVDETFNPYAECGRNCALKVNEFVRGVLNSTLPISCVFDHGDEGRGMLIELMRLCNLPAPIFRNSRMSLKHPERDIENPPFVPLQAADLLSWEIRRWKIDYKNKERMRKSLKAFTDMEHIIWKECTYEDMARVIHSIGIPRRNSVPA